MAKDKQKDKVESSETSTVVPTTRFAKGYQWTKDKIYSAGNSVKNSVCSEHTARIVLEGAAITGAAIIVNGTVLTPQLVGGALGAASLLEGSSTAVIYGFNTIKNYMTAEVKEENSSEDTSKDESTLGKRSKDDQPKDKPASKRRKENEESSEESSEEAVKKPAAKKPAAKKPAAKKPAAKKPATPKQPARRSSRNK